MSMTIRSSKDPYVVGFTEADIVKTTEDNTLLLCGVLLIVITVFSIFLPIKLILTKGKARFLPPKSRQANYVDNASWDSKNPSYDTE
mmetsp:Transcript_42818/g.50206  ORF Transcript_42818/g.50206 Transcript_42818/m.50206 type:complete len:87 (-) Transcript_42818:46-306(-)